MPAVFAPTHVMKLEALPLNATGKVDRQRLRAMLTSGAPGRAT